MANLTITNCDTGSVTLESGSYRDETLALSAADTAAEGTILARKVVSTTVTVGADSGNTGDGTVTASVVGGDDIPKAGAWNFECIEAVTNGGVFKLENPDGGIEASGLAMNTASAASVTFEIRGISILATDGDTDFAVGDKFSLTVAADGDLVYFATDGAGGAQIPTAVLTYDVTVTEATDVAVRVMTTGRVRKERLIIDADGDDSNITTAILDQLRGVGIIAETVTELNDLDNQ